jgi:hypothetical protein
LAYLGCHPSGHRGDQRGGVSASPLIGELQTLFEVGRMSKRPPKSQHERRRQFAGDVARIVILKALNAVITPKQEVGDPDHLEVFANLKVFAATIAGSSQNMQRP